MNRIFTYTLLFAFAACSEERVETETAVDQTSGAETTTINVDPSDVHIEGDHITVDGHINFASDSDTILEDSNELLDHIAQIISYHPDEVTSLKIIGHTDASGDTDHNIDLSNRRAAAVEQALIARGVTIPLQHEGVGENQPLCTEESDECQAMNRRVEFLIVTQ